MPPFVQSRLKDALFWAGVSLGFVENSANMVLLRLARNLLINLNNVGLEPMCGLLPPKSYVWVASWIVLTHFQKESSQ